MAYDIESYFAKTVFLIETQNDTMTEVAQCLACGALVGYDGKKFHYEFHLKHRDMPRKNNK